jgi:hypothetical protein
VAGSTKTSDFNLTGGVSKMSRSTGATRHSTALIPLVLEFHCFTSAANDCLPRAQVQPGRNDVTAPWDNAHPRVGGALREWLTCGDGNLQKRAYPWRQGKTGASADG